MSLSGLGATVAANTIHGSAATGIVLANVPGGGATQVIENTIANNVGDGITVKPGADGTAIHNNNITHNGVGLGNESTLRHARRDAQLVGLADRSQRSVHRRRRRDRQPRRRRDTAFIEFLCKPFPQGFPSIMGVCSTETAELRQLVPGTQPRHRSVRRATSPSSRPPTSTSIRHGTSRHQQRRRQPGDLPAQPPAAQEARGVCLGGLPPCDFNDVAVCAACTRSQDCPGDPGVDPIVLNGECVDRDA